MTARDPTNSYPPTADRLRHDISRGKAGDKVDHPDLAAAPLGTDDEAAGRPASPEELRIAATNINFKRQDQTVVGAGTIYVAIVIAIVAIILAIAFIFR